MTIDREDITALKEIMNQAAIEKATFSECMQLMADFVNDMLLKDPSLATPAIRQQITAECILPARFFLQQQLTKDELERYRINAWNWHDQWEGSGKQLIRVAICCLYDKETAEFDTYGAETLFETFLSCLFDLDKKYCDVFSAYIIPQLNSNTQQS